MSVEFVSKTKINNNFLNSVIGQLKYDQGKERFSDEREILMKIINDLEHESKRFEIQENEHNFLAQNKKDLWADYLIFRYKFRVYPVIKQLVDFPTHLLVEPVSYCNLKCLMCFQSDRSFVKSVDMGCIDIGLFKDIIDEAEAEGCRALTMASRGEPTMHPRFSDILSYAKDKFFDFKLNTNAMLLDEEKCHQILQNNVTELVFSVDSADKDEYERIRRHGKFEKVIANIKRFHEIRKKKYPQSKCKTRISAVKFVNDFNTDYFVKFWELIVDSVACVIARKRWNSYDNEPFARHSPCPLLWERMYIWWDGTVNPCDYDYKSLLSLGSIRKMSIKDIWKGKKFVKLRENHIKGDRQRHKPCDRCEK